MPHEYQFVGKAGHNTTPVVRFYTVMGGRNSIQWAIQMVQPNAHKWEKLRDPHCQANKLLEGLDRGLI